MRSILQDGYSVRLSGQDCGRGTFAHRHAVHAQPNTNLKSLVPLRSINSNQAQFLVIDSVLSEEAVLAFEYGYSQADPDTLVIWEGSIWRLSLTVRRWLSISL